MTAEWSMVCTINGRNQILLERDDENWKMNGLMYIRVDHTEDDSESTRNYTITVRSKNRIYNYIIIL